MSDPAPPAAPAPRPSAAGYLIYALILAIPFAYRRFDFNTQFTVELRRIVLFGLFALGAGFLLVRAPVLWTRKSPLGLPLKLFLGGACFATAFSVNPALAHEGALFLLLCGALFYLAYCYLEPAADVPMLSRAAIVSATLIAGYSLLQHLGYNPALLVAEGDQQRSATFTTRNLMATPLAFALVLLVDRALRQRDRWLPLTWLALVIVAAGLLLSQTVGAYLAVLGALAVYALLAWRLGVDWTDDAGEPVRWQTPLAALAACGLLVGVAVILIDGQLPRDRKLRVGEKLSALASGEHRSVRQRELMWRLAYQVFAAELMTGCGPGCYELRRIPFEARYFGADNPRFRPITGLSRWPHNDVLQVACELGLVGLLPYLWLCWAALLLPWQLLSTPRLRRHLALTLPWYAGAVAIWLHGLVHFSLDAPAAALLAWTALGLVACCNVGGGRRPLVKTPRARAGLRIAIALAALGAAALLLLELVALVSSDAAFERMLQARGLQPQLERIARRHAAFARAASVRAPGSESHRAASAEAERLRKEGLALSDRRSALIEDARRLYSRTVSLRPHSTRLWWQLGTLQRMARRGADLAERQAEAERSYQRGLRVANDFVLLQALAELALERQDLEGAERHAREAVRVRPNAPLAHCQLGLVDLERGELEAALAHFEEARDADARHPQGYIWGAVAFSLAGQPARGQELLEQGVDRMPDQRLQQDMLLMMVLLQMQMGSPNRARRLLTLVRRLSGQQSTGEDLGELIDQREGLRARELLPLTLAELVARLRARLDELGVGAPWLAVACQQEADAFEAALAAGLEQLLSEPPSQSGAERQAIAAGEALIRIQLLLGDALDAGARRALERQPLPSERTFTEAAQRLLEELPLYRQNLLGAEQPGSPSPTVGGPLVGKSPDQRLRWHRELEERIARLAEVPSARRPRAFQTGPLYRDELRALERVAVVFDSALDTSDPLQRASALADDIALLRAEDLLTAARQADPLDRDPRVAAARAALQPLTVLDLQRSLLPPWAAAIYDRTDVPDRDDHARRAPSTALLARLRLIELELVAGHRRRARDAADALLAFCRAAGRELDSRRWSLPLDEQGKPLPLAALNRYHAVDRQAQRLGLLATLGTPAAAARSAALRADFPDEPDWLTHPNPRQALLRLLDNAPL